MTEAQNLAHIGKVCAVGFIETPNPTLSYFVNIVMTFSSFAFRQTFPLSNIQPSYFYSALLSSMRKTHA